MAKLVIGGAGCKSAEKAILDALPGILGYAKGKFRGHPDLDRILADVQNHAWKYVAQRFEPGKELPINLNLLCKMAAQGYGIDGKGRAKRLPTKNDSRLLHGLRAKERHQDLQLDLAAALDSLNEFQREIVRMFLESHQWSEICETLRTNVYHLQVAREELRRLLADYR